MGNIVDVRNFIGALLESQRYLRFGLDSSSKRILSPWISPSLFRTGIRNPLGPLSQQRYAVRQFERRQQQAGLSGVEAQGQCIPYPPAHFARSSCPVGRAFSKSSMDSMLSTNTG